MVDALNGRKLCENTVGLLEEKGVANWQSAGAADKTEWVHQIRTLTTLFPPYQLQEDGHPNYWGQLALRNCFRQAYNGGASRGGSCARQHRPRRQGRAEHGAQIAQSSSGGPDSVLAAPFGLNANARTIPACCSWTL